MVTTHIRSVVIIDTFEVRLGRHHHLGPHLSMYPRRLAMAIDVL